MIYNYVYDIKCMSGSQETFEALRHFNIIEGRKKLYGKSKQK